MRKPPPPPRNKPPDVEKLPLVGLPYIQGLSEHLGRLFREHYIKTYHKPVNTLRSQLVRPKDKLTTDERSGVIYKIECDQCEGTYIGETKRPLSTRVKEHLKINSNSALAEHTESTGHIIPASSASVINIETNLFKRKVKEAIEIYKHQPTMNRDEGCCIPAVYQSMLSCDSTRTDQSDVANDRQLVLKK
jgi:hypothetical protein